jgi:hypothetical protein
MQMKGLLTKRFLQTSRSWLQYLTLAVVVPIVMAVVCGIVTDVITSLDETDQPDPLLITLADYPDIQSLVEEPKDDIPYGQDVAQLFTTIISDVISKNSNDKKDDFLSHRLYLIGFFRL